MRITIDNQNGLGPIDYTSSVVPEGPITIQRVLNEPTRCTVEVLLDSHGLAAPVRRARVVVTNASGTILFTGYLAIEPIPIYMGTGVRGAIYRTRLSAVSDEWLLDKQGSGASATVDGVALAQSGTALIAQMTQVVQSSSGSVTSNLTVNVGGDLRAIGAFAIDPSTTWTTNAGAVANATYASYRVVNGAVSVLPAGSSTHSFSDADGTLNIAELTTSHVHELANDITLSGTEEPAAYVQEIFQGDGATTKFDLSQAVFQGTNKVLLKDNFNEPSYDPSQWKATDPSSCLQLTSNGLTLNGGTGVDGQTTLAGVNPVEMGGFLLAQAGGVVFGSASSGVLVGFYSGGSQLSECVGGFRVRQSVSSTGGVTVLVPIVNGVEVGTVFTPTAGHKYTLRLRAFCVEMQRVPQQYYCMVDGQVEEFGAAVLANLPMQIVLELIDEGASSNTPATVLYDSASSGALIASVPALCTFVAVSSTELYGSIGSLQLTRPGSAWITDTMPDGTAISRLAGAAGQGVDCKLTYGNSNGATGQVNFFSGRVPIAGERITVFYRSSRRSIARFADPASISAEIANGNGIVVPGVSRWLGKVEAPEARSSADCEAAAQAVLAMATARTAAQAGSYKTSNPAQDIWPGDVLEITSDGQLNAFLVRSVSLTDAHAVPEYITYGISFANDWATEWSDGLGLRLSDTLAKDAIIPPTASSAPSAVLANLQQLSVVSITDAAIQVDAGIDPPEGGGFEVRLRDWEFGASVDLPDLVLQSPVRSFSLPRAAQTEEFFIRMYDGSFPAVYSRFSSVLVVNWPLD